VAHNDDLAMKSPFLRLGGKGDIDIGHDRLDYLARVSVVDSIKGQEGKDLQHLKGLTVPVRVSGPFDKLAYNIEFGGLVAEAAKAKVEEFVARRTKMAETKIAQAEAQAIADVRSAAADAAVAAAETLLTETVKGKLAGQLVADGIKGLAARLN